MMKRQLSLVEMATYGYNSTRVNKGSWLEQKFGTKNNEVEKSEHTERPNQDKNKQTGR